MKRVVTGLILFLTAGFAFIPAKGSSFDTDTLKAIKPKEHYRSQTVVITELLSRYHYQKFKLNDSLSSAILDRYIESLDPNKLYFLSDDIQEFEAYRNRLDNDLKEGNLEAAYRIFNVFLKRFEERMPYLSILLSQEFDFSKEEYYETDRDKRIWSSDVSELNEAWRKTIKNQLLSLKISGKETGEALSVLNKRYKNYQKIIRQYNSEDIYQLYMNSLSGSYDPHTNYFSPKSSEDFNIQMSLSLEGIGARLSSDGDYTIVVAVLAGGPAFKSENIHENDKIVAVAQDDDGEWVDVIGWRVDDVVQLIRGPKGTVVRLQVLKEVDGINAKPQTVRMVREKIKLEEQSAQKEVIPVYKDGKEYKLGIITIPAFYINFEEARRGVKDYKSTTRDVRILLQELKEEDVDGVMIDLRRNGGGSLQEAIELTGLFIPQGPVVQVKNSRGKIAVEQDPDPGIAWEGPLSVLINRYSASASEIFAGAIQDYKRGIVIGEQSYGKGTVQSLIDLDQFIKNTDQKLGQLKITLSKYYRVTGESTQHLGVRPDIMFPSAFEPEETGESSMPSALPWDEIPSAFFNSSGKVSDELLKDLKERFDERLKTDKDLLNLLAEIEEMKRKQEKTVVSLNEVERKREIEEEEERKAKMAALKGKIVSAESGQIEYSDLEMEDTFLKEGLILLAELVAIDMG